MLGILNGLFVVDEFYGMCEALDKFLANGNDGITKTNNKYLGQLQRLVNNLIDRFRDKLTDGNEDEFIDKYTVLSASYPAKDNRYFSDKGVKLFVKFIKSDPVNEKLYQQIKNKLNQLLMVNHKTQVPKPILAELVKKQQKFESRQNQKQN